MFGLPWYTFAGCGLVVFAAVFLGKLPRGMIGAFPLMIVLGTVFGKIGEKTPVVRNFLGGSAIVTIFGSAALTSFKLLPESTILTMQHFMDGEGFLDFYIAALITGSIMGMNRKLLIRTGIRYFPAMIGGVAAAFGLVALVGVLIGYGAREAILFIGIPIMGGGMGAGAVPLSQIFSQGMRREAAEMLTMMIPAVALGNALSIVAAGLLNRLGKAVKPLSGNGMIIRSSTPAAASELELSPEYRQAQESIDIIQLGAGLFFAVAFFALGALVNYLVPELHGYAWMILLVAHVKALGIFPRRLEICCYQWYQFVVNNLTGVLLVGLGVRYTDLRQIASAFTPQYLVLVTVTVIGAILGSGLIGRLMGLYPIEASITAGLGMANMGGTGDVAVLSASQRMELMPFAQISSRIGGALILILASALLPPLP
jgi:CCS family citrate carrier protein